MSCILWVIFQMLAIVVEGGVSSGSAEALLKGGANNNGKAAAAAGNGANAGAQNGIPLIGEPIVGRLVQLGGSLFIQPVGNPVGQPPLQQLTPITALQQGGTIPGGANGNQQGLMAQQAGGGMLFVALPQNTAGINPQPAVLTHGQVQMIAVAGPNNQQGAAGVGGTPIGGVRFLRSVAARLRTPSPSMKATAAEEEEEEEFSGMDTKEEQL